MTSSVVEGGSEKPKRQPSDFIAETMNLTAESLSLTTETFFRAASSLCKK